jgi:enamine deaminase RidA (YjgF/YER057c/UK114 family)
MDSAIVKILSEAGVGIAAILALAIIVYNQMKTMAEMGKVWADAFKGMGDTIEQNTEATKELTTMVKGFRETDLDVIRSIEHCKNKAR